MLYKDACNFKSNQKNLGTIKSSNLCTEIVEYTAPNEARGKTWFPVLVLLIVEQELIPVFTNVIP